MRQKVAAVMFIALSTQEGSVGIFAKTQSYMSKSICVIECLKFGKAGP